MLSRVSLSLAGVVTVGVCGSSSNATVGASSSLPAPDVVAASAGTQAQGTPTVPLPPEAGTPTGPAGTAGVAASPGGYDHVGYASVQDADAMGQPARSSTTPMSGGATAAHPTLPIGSFAEVTSLETGHTMLVQITDSGPIPGNREIALSPAAAQAIGIDDRAIGGVRVRSVTPSPVDAVAVQQGRMAAARLDTPESVLRALRRDLPVTAIASSSHATPHSRPVPPAKPTAATRAGASYAAPSVRTSPQPGYTPSAPLRSERALVADPMSEPRRTPSVSTATTPSRQGFVVQVAALSSAERARKLAQSLRGTVSQGDGIWRVRLGPFRDLAGAQAARDDAVRRGYGDAAILMAP